ncbi:MAG: MarR family transcriptional regulator [Hyphomicrobiales bacterium]|nr:MAG: MarR family transcriptional regulator [Hyphomicrobiales bacterium]
MKEDTKTAKLGLPDDFICFATYSLSHAFNHFYRPLLQKLGLTYPQYLVMVLLWRGDDLKVKDIGSKLNLESNTLTPMLKRLETIGLIERARDAQDERSVRVTLTKEGKQLKEAAQTIPNCLTEAIGLEREEMMKLIKTLKTLQSKLLKM